MRNINIFLLVCLSAILSSCNQSKDGRSSSTLLTIEVPKQRNAQLAKNELMIKDFSVIQLQDTIPVGEVLDMAILDTICYILDSNRNIYGVSLENGSLYYKYTRHGGSEYETVSPITITTDSNNVYVYDTGKSHILVFTPQLKPEKGIRSSFITPHSFKKVNRGFLCLSISDKQDIVFIDDNGKIEYEKTLSELNMHIRQSHSLIQQGVDDRFYIKAMYSDTIYRWNDSEIGAVYALHYGDSSIPRGMNNSNDIENTQREFTMDFFILQHGLYSSFIDRSCNTVCYNYYNFNSAMSQAGYVKPLNSIPFFPHWQFGRIMLSAFHPEYIVPLRKKMKEEADINLKDEGLIIFKYLL